MKLGVLLGVVDGTEPRAVVKQSKAIESQGYSSIWSAQAMGRGFMLADPFVTLSAVAAVTTVVEIGTAILQLPLYNPTDIALKSYSLGQLSGGRFILGIGAGSTQSDYDIHHADFSNRFQVFEDNLVRLRHVFETRRANEIEINPWDSMDQGVPLYFGTWGRNIERAAAQFDGWIASAMHRSVEQVTTAIQSYRAAGGRRAIVSTIQLPPGQDLGELRDRLTRYQEAGFDDAVVMFLPGGPGLEEVRKLLD